MVYKGYGSKHKKALLYMKIKQNVNFNIKTA